jgi:hypothetical protein
MAIENLTQRVSDFIWKKPIVITSIVGVSLTLLGGIVITKVDSELKRLTEKADKLEAYCGIDKPVNCNVPDKISFYSRISTVKGKTFLDFDAYPKANNKETRVQGTYIITVKDKKTGQKVYSNSKMLYCDDPRDWRGYTLHGTRILGTLSNSTKIGNLEATLEFTSENNNNKSITAK